MCYCINRDVSFWQTEKICVGRCMSDYKYSDQHDHDRWGNYEHSSLVWSISALLEECSVDETIVFNCIKIFSFNNNINNNK